MRYLRMTILLLSATLITLNGCNNQQLELEKCQENNKSMESELQKARDQLAHDEMASTEMLASVLEDNTKLTAEIKELRGKVRSEVGKNAQLREEIKSLKSRIAQLEDKSGQTGN